MRTTNTCHTCRDYYGCMKIWQKPSGAECPIRRTDHRHAALLHIADVLKKKRIAFLRRALDIEVDLIGCDFPYRVRKIALPDGVKADGLDFYLGNDEYGSPVWTSHLSTNDIIKIKEQI